MHLTIPWIVLHLVQLLVIIIVVVVVIVVVIIVINSINSYYIDVKTSSVTDAESWFPASHVQSQGDAGHDADTAGNDAAAGRSTRPGTRSGVRCLPDFIVILLVFIAL